MTTQQVLRSGYGLVALPPRTVAGLRENATGWIALAELHFGLAQTESTDGDLDKAIEHVRYMESKLERARQVLIEARDLKNAQELAAMEIES